MFGCYSIANSAVDGSSAIFRNINAAEKLFLHDPNVPATSVFHLFERAVNLFPDSDFLGRREFLANSYGDYEWLSYSQVAKIRDNLGSGIKFLLKKSNLNVGIYSINRPEWIITDLACNAYSMCTVALYDTLGPDVVKFILNHADIRMVFASLDRIPDLLAIYNKKLFPNLDFIVCFDSLDENIDPLGFKSTRQFSLTTNKILRAWASSKGINLLSFKQVCQIGAKNVESHVPPSASTIATICYTSGTTGDPKGAILTHGNLVAQNVLRLNGLDCNQNDTYFSYLPLAHVFERSGIIQMLTVCGRIGVFSGSVDRIVEDAQRLKPTVFISVPRLLNKIYAKVKSATLDASGVKGILFRHAYKVKLNRLTNNLGPKHAFWDRLLFSKVANILGGQIRVMITGSAPISGDVLEFLRIFFSVNVVEGFGQTENGAAATVQIPGDPSTGNVGIPLASCEIKLMDVPDMSYLVSDKPYPRGEVCIRGPIVFAGYFKDPIQTAEAIDKENWLHTGDIGLINSKGALSIIDRKKNIFKLAQGEYCAPEKIENIFIQSPLIAQIFVHGDSQSWYLVAIVVPNEENFIPWARNLLKQDLEISEMIKNTRIYDGLMLEINKIAKINKLNGYEIPKAIYIEVNPFSVENNLLTPSFKLKRPQAAAKYRQEIDRMYRNSKL